MKKVCVTLTYDEVHALREALRIAVEDGAADDPHPTFSAEIAEKLSMKLQEWEARAYFD